MKLGSLYNFQAGITELYWPGALELEVGVEGTAGPLIFC